MKECPRCHVCLDDAVEHCPHDGMRLETALEGVGIIDGKYRVEQRLGQGGMGVVYRGRHVALDRTFALKLIRSASGGRSFAGRFQIEARALGKLKHPNIVEVTDYGVDPRGPGLPYLVMEYLEGTTLQDLCEEIGALPVDRALPLLDSIAQAIDYAHQHGVLHRDLKPGNVFLARNEATAETAKILDFGLARLLEQPLAGEGSRIHEAETPQRLAPDKSPQGETGDLSQTEYPPLSRPLIPSAERVTQKGTLTGTPAYMAPEIVRGDDATSASDIYAFGILTYQVLVGRLPFDGIVSEIIHSHLEQAPPAPSTLRDISVFARHSPDGPPIGRGGGSVAGIFRPQGRSASSRGETSAPSASGPFPSSDAGDAAGQVGLRKWRRIRHTCAGVRRGKRSPLGEPPL